MLVASYDTWVVLGMIAFWAVVIALGIWLLSRLFPPLPAPPDPGQPPVAGKTPKKH